MHAWALPLATWKFHAENPKFLFARVASKHCKFHIIRHHPIFKFKIQHFLVLTLATTTKRGKKKLKKFFEGTKPSVVKSAGSLYHDLLELLVIYNSQDRFSITRINQSVYLFYSLLILQFGAFPLRMINWGSKLNEWSKWIVKDEYIVWLIHNLILYPSNLIENIYNLENGEN